MGKQTFKTEEVPTLSIVECRGDLIISGSPRSEVFLHAEESDLEASQEGNTIMASCQSDLRVEAPYGASIQIQQVRGDLVIKRVQGSIVLGVVEGDLALSRVGAATIDQVGGDLAGRVVDGDLAVKKVQGDMSVRNVSGQVMIDLVGRDLGARELQRDAYAKEVQGDVRLRTAFLPGHEYRFKALGDIVARVPLDTDADLTLRSGRNKIRIKAALEDRVEADGQVTGRLGSGGATVNLDAEKDLVLVARGSSWSQVGADIGALGADIGVEFGTEFASLAEEIATQVQEHMEGVSAQLEEKLAHLEVDVAGIDQRAAQAAERAAEQARRQIERAGERLRRRAEREAEKARRRADKARWKANRYSTRGAPAPKPTGEPVSDTERLVILNMVAEGKISIEEAESLLEALNT